MTPLRYKKQMYYEIMKLLPYIYHMKFETIQSEWYYDYIFYRSVLNDMKKQACY